MTTTSLIEPPRTPIEGDAVGLRSMNGQYVPYRFHSVDSSGYTRLTAAVSTMLTVNTRDPSNDPYIEIWTQRQQPDTVVRTSYGDGVGQWRFADEVTFRQICGMCLGLSRESKDACANCKGSGSFPFDPFADDIKHL